MAPKIELLDAETKATVIITQILLPGHGNHSATGFKSVSDFSGATSATATTTTAVLRGSVVDVVNAIGSASAGLVTPP
jgi:hypothetical protein